MRRLPTDLQILNAIYDRYYGTFSSYRPGDTSRVEKMYVPIDVGEIAKKLKVDGDLVFGRLYYHLDKKYRYRQENGNLVPLFYLEVSRGDKVDRHVVNFPYLAAVLGPLRESRRRFQLSTLIAVVSLAVAIVSLLFSLIGLQQE